MGFDAFFPQMYVVTQNELLWATYHWEAIAVSISSCWWWLFTFGTICPRSCLLSCSVVVLGCLPWDRHLRSSAPGCQSLVAGRKPLLASGDWSSLGKHLGHGRQRLDGWRSRRPGDVGMLHWGIVWVQKKGKRITRWKTIASKGMGTWETGRSLLPIAPYLMCFHSRDMSSAWAVWNLWVVFQVNLERQQATCKAPLTVLLPILAAFSTQLIEIGGWELKRKFSAPKAEGAGVRWWRE